MFSQKKLHYGYVNNLQIDCKYSANTCIDTPNRQNYIQLGSKYASAIVLFTGSNLMLAFRKISFTLLIAVVVLNKLIYFMKKLGCTVNFFKTRTTDMVKTVTNTKLDCSGFQLYKSSEFHSSDKLKLFCSLDVICLLILLVLITFNRLQWSIGKLESTSLQVRNCVQTTILYGLRRPCPTLQFLIEGVDVAQKLPIFHCV